MDFGKLQLEVKLWPEQYQKICIDCEFLVTFNILENLSESKNSYFYMENKYGLRCGKKLAMIRSPLPRADQNNTHQMHQNPGKVHKSLLSV